MRIVVEDVAIAPNSAGLGFVAIHHDVVRLAVVVLDEAPLRAAREAGAAASAEVRGLDGVDDGGRLHGECFLELLVAAVGDVMSIEAS